MCNFEKKNKQTNLPIKGALFAHALYGVFNADAQFPLKKRKKKH